MSTCGSREKMRRFHQRQTQHTPDRKRDGGL